MNIFSCFRAVTCFLYLNELIYNILCNAQNPYKIARFVQMCTNMPFVRTAVFCTKLVQKLYGLELVGFQRVARGSNIQNVRLHKKMRLIF